MKAGHNQTEIADILGVHKSIISRELKRNCGLRGYRSKQAQHLAETRRLDKAQPRFTAVHWQWVETLLFFILGGTRCADNRGVHYRTPVDLQTVFLKVGINQVKELVTQVGLPSNDETCRSSFHPAPALLPERYRQSCAWPRNRRSLLRRQGRAGWTNAVENRYAAYARCRWACDLPLSGWDRTVQQPLPGNQGFHIVQKPLFSSFFAMFLETVCQGLLAHNSKPVKSEWCRYYRKN